MMDPKKAPLSQLFAYVKQVHGLSNRKIAQQLGRSEALVRKILSGACKNEAYRQPGTELAETGQVQHQAPRRRRKDGKLVRIRAPRGAKKKSVVPSDTRGTPVPKPRRSVFIHHKPVEGENGNKFYQIDMPVGQKTKGRAAGFAAAMEDLHDVTRRQAHTDKRVNMNVTVQNADGTRHQLRVGTKRGFHASDVLSDVKDQHQGSIESWIMHQVQSVYNGANGRVVQIQMVSFDAVRSKEERKKQDQAGTRRGFWSQFRKRR